MNSLLARLKAVWTHSVRRQLILGVALVHAVLMTFFVFDLVREQRAFLHHEAIVRSGNLARGLAAASTSWVLANDVAGLQEVVRSQQDASMDYACVLAPSGQVLGHTEPGLVGKYVSDPMSRALLAGPPEPRLLLESSDQIDVAAPILVGTRMLGWARVGLNQGAQHAELALVQRNGLLFTALAVLAGCVMAWLVARPLAAGLERLVRAVDAVRGGDRRVRAYEAGQDEVARLGAGFNAMLRAVAEGEEKFRTVADFGPEWEYWRGPDGALVWMSPSCRDYTGFSSEAFLANPGLLELVVHPADLDIYRAHLHGMELAGALAARLEFRVLRRDGVVLWIEHRCQPIARPDGTDLGRRVTNRDVTPRRESEEALRRWASVFENAAWGLVICSARSARLEAINPAFAAMHGYTVAELEGQPVDSVYPEDQLSQFHAEMEKAHVQGHHTFEVDHLRRDGGRFPVQMDVTAVKDSQGEILYRIVNVQDITERRSARDELVRAKEAAESAAAAKSDFLAIMSHELRTPLNGIKGMLQVLRDGDLQGEEARDFLEHAIAASDNLTLVLNDVLDVTRMEAGRMTMTEAPFAPEEAVAPVCAGLAMAARQKGVDLSYWLDPALPPLLVGDAGRIRQVLLNLLGNAVKFTERGAVRLDVLALPPAPGTAADGRLDVLLAVQDTGLGMPALSLARIFEPFTQLESPYTRSHGGAGLGLNIVRRLVSLMRGGIEVYSLPGQGTEFYVRLPLRAETRTEASEPALLVRAGGGSDSASRPGPLRVLVVEDDALNRLSAAKFLERLGYDAWAASGGAEALAVLERSGADAVLMDIQMPDMDGLETLRRIRAARGGKAWAEVPVVAVTAHALAGDREHFLAAGMSAYLAKPYSLEELEAVLLRVLERA